MNLGEGFEDREKYQPEGFTLRFHFDRYNQKLDLTPPDKGNRRETHVAGKSLTGVCQED